MKVLTQLWPAQAALDSQDLGSYPKWVPGSSVSPHHVPEQVSNCQDLMLWTANRTSSRKCLPLHNLGLFKTNCAYLLGFRRSLKVRNLVRFLSSRPT